MKFQVAGTSNILNSPTASGPTKVQPTASVTTPGVGRLLPNVPKRFVVPRVSAKDLEEQHRKGAESFEDENNAVTHLGGLQR